MREFTGHSKEILLLKMCGSFLIMFHVSLCNAILSVPCGLVVAFWEWLAPLGSLICGIFFVLCGVPGRVFCLVVSIPDLCLLPYFE